MIILPFNLVQLNRLPGYYYDKGTKELFSLKSGVLRKMKFQKGWPLNRIPSGYTISHNGCRRRLTTEVLDRMTQNIDPESQIQKFPTA